jgi:hypothetical protein
VKTSARENLHGLNPVPARGKDIWLPPAGAEARIRISAPDATTARSCQIKVKKALPILWFVDWEASIC